MHLNEAIILAGGRGSRLGELTKYKPKPLVEVLGRPILEHLIRNAKETEVDRFIICLGYLGEKIREYFEDGSKFGVKIEYIQLPVKSPEEALFAAKNLVKADDFYCFCGDNILQPWQIQLIGRLHSERCFAGVRGNFTLENGESENIKRVKVGFNRIWGSGINSTDPVLVYNMAMSRHLLDTFYEAGKDKDEKSFALVIDEIVRKNPLCTVDIGDFININIPEDIINAEAKLRQKVIDGKYILHVRSCCPRGSIDSVVYDERFYYVLSNQKVPGNMSVNLSDEGCTCFVTDCSSTGICSVVAVEPFTNERAEKLDINYKLIALIKEPVLINGLVKGVKDRTRPFTYVKCGNYNRCVKNGRKK